MPGKTYANKIYAAPLGRATRPAAPSQITTAGGICAVLDMLSAGKLPQIRAQSRPRKTIKLPAVSSRTRFRPLLRAGGARRPPTPA